MSIICPTCRRYAACCECDDGDGWCPGCVWCEPEGWAHRKGTPPKQVEGQVTELIREMVADRIARLVMPPWPNAFLYTCPVCSERHSIPFEKLPKPGESILIPCPNKATGAKGAREEPHP